MSEEKKAYYAKIIFTIIFIGIIIMSSSTKSIGNSNDETEDFEETINQQKESFGINSFIENAEKFSGDFFEGIDVNEILNSAISGKVDSTNIYQKILNVLGSEVQTGIKSLLSILIIIIIHSILKSISENLENDNISKLIYYAQYIAIVTVIMGNFSGIIVMCKDTATNLVGFMNSLVPILISLMLYTGSITTSGIVEPIILFLINLIGNLIENILIPITLIIAALCIVSKVSDKVQVGKISKFLQSGVVWFLGIVLTIFVGVLSLEGTLSSSVDGITAKTAKAVVSSAVPIVGKILGDAVDTVLRMWNNFKKCSRICRCLNCCWNMYNANNKTRNINNML